MSNVDEDGYPEDYPLPKEQFLRAKEHAATQLQQAKESSDDV